MSDFFTNEEVDIILGQCLKGEEDKPMSDDDVKLIQSWAEMSRVHGILLNMVLKKQIILAIKNGQVVFSVDPHFATEETNKNIINYLKQQKK